MGVRSEQVGVRGFDCYDPYMFNVMGDVGEDAATAFFCPPSAEGQVLRELPVLQLDFVKRRQKGAELCSKRQAPKAAVIEDGGAALQHAGDAFAGDQQDSRSASFNPAESWITWMGFLRRSDEVAGLGEGLGREAVQLLEIDGSLRVDHAHYVFLEGHHLADQLVRKAHIGIKEQQVAAVGFVVEEIRK